MNRYTVPRAMIAGIVTLVWLSSAHGGEPARDFDRAALRSQLSTVLPATRSQAAAVGREIAGRAMLELACSKQDMPAPGLRLAAAGRIEKERS